MSKTKRLQLTRGQFAIVDATNYEQVSKYNWSVEGGVNNRLVVSRANYDGDTHNIGLGHEIMRPKDGDVVIYLNGNPLDCTRANLRTCSRALQKQRATICKNKSSKSSYKGVRRQRNRWRACIGQAGKTYHLGMFDNEIDAAKAYDEAANRLYGSDSYRNFTNRVRHKRLPNLPAHNAIKRRHLARYRSDTALKYKGVSLAKGKFRACITHNYRKISLGTFTNATQAAHAYDAAATRLFGDDCYLNFPNRNKKKGA